MSNTSSRRLPLQDISNKVHLIQTNTSALKKKTLGGAITKHSTNNNNHSINSSKTNINSGAVASTLTLRKKYDETYDEMDYYEEPSPSSIGSMEDDFEDLNDLKEFYEDVSHEINDKVAKSLEKEKEKNTKLELRSERDRAQIFELQSENKQLAQTVEQLKQKSTKYKDVDFKQVQQLNEKISKLERKVEIETQQKERLSNLVKSKEQALSKIKEENDKVTKGPVEEKCSRKLQDQIKIKEEKIERLGKEIEKEKNTKQEYENLIQGLQEVSDNLRMKLSASNEEIETSNKLIEILDAKLKIANDRCKDLDERLKKGEEKREEESSELIALREEMAHLCDSVLKEKQDSERKTQQINQIQAAKEKIETDFNRTSSKLKEFEEENQELRDVIEKLETQIEHMGHDIDDSSKELEELEENFRKRLDNAEATINEKNSEIQSMAEKEERTMEQLKELDVFVERTKRKIDKEKEKTRDAEERANSEYEKALQMIERNNSLMKKLDSVSRSNFSMVEELKDKDDLLLRFKNYIEETETKLSRKESEYEQICSRLNSTFEDLQKEKAKSERSWKELEETVKMLHQIQGEKEVLEKKSSHSKEVLEMKMNNKISMLEKKCDYLKRLQEMNGSNENDQIKEMENYIEKLTAENEKSSEAVSNLEIALTNKDSEISTLNEKIRQLEDLLNNQNQLHSASLKPNDLKKRLMTVEKSMDEIIIELTIEGITISQLNPREKAVLILERFNEIKKECQTLSSVNSQYTAEVQRLREAKENSEKQMMVLKDALTKEALDRNEECISDLSESCHNLYTKINAVIEERELENTFDTPVDPYILEDLLESVLSIQVNLKKVKHHMNQVDTLQNVIESQDVFNKDFVSLCGELENRVRSLMEERDTLLTAQLQMKNNALTGTAKKKLDKLLYRTSATQTIQFQTQGTEAEIQTEESGMEAEREENIDHQLEEDHENLKNRYQKLLATCHKYKKLMLKFTQLHAKEKTNTIKSLSQNSKNSHPVQQEEEHQDMHQEEQYESEEEQSEEQEEYHDNENIPVIHASLQYSSKESTPKSSRHGSSTNSRDNSPSNQSVSSVRSVSTTLSAMSERSSISTYSSKLRKNQVPKDFNKPNSYLTSHMSVKARLK